MTAAGLTGTSWQGLVKTAQVSVADYLAELEKMVTAQTNWASNMMILAGRVSGTTLAELAKLGPSGAPLVANLVNASDAELARLETAFAARGENATA